MSASASRLNPFALRAPPIDRVAGLAFRGQQFGLLYPAMLIHRVLRRAMGERPSPSAVTATFLKRAHELIEEDWANTERGVYPRDALFRYPFPTHLRRFPRWLREIGRSYRRMQSGNFRDLPPEEDLRQYPAYYRRTFHWQTDGYLSHESAQLYDLGVEFLFLGLADVMRRQVLPPIYDHFQAQGRSPESILDVACGTARTMLYARDAFPEAEITGIDLSRFYLHEATALHGDDPKARFRAANAEALPFEDASFDALTCVHLFHELPRSARRNVFRELRRVLRPGGILVVMDSAQYAESPEIGFALEKFSADFHEPFHSDYVKDDLKVIAEEHGFTVTRVAPCFAAKILVATPG